MDTKQSNAIDIMKLFFAICIVGIHTNVLDHFSSRCNWYVTHLLFRLAVPFFFITSGFFFGRKFLQISGDKTERLNICHQYIHKNLPMFIFWGGFGLIWYTITLIIEQDKFVIIKMIRTALFYPRGAMWYLAASMVAIWIIGELWNHKNLLILIALGGYSFALLANTYYFLVENTWVGQIINLYMKIFISARNAIGVGILYIGLGIWISSENNPLRQWNTKRIVSMCCILFIIYYIEVTITYGKHVLDDSSCFIVLPLFSMMLFLLIQRTYVPVSREQSFEIRKLSVYLYCLHPAIDSIGRTYILKKFNSYVLYFFINLMLCLTIWMLTKKSKNKIIRTVLP